jgi:hypothetical protein
MSGQQFTNNALATVSTATLSDSETTIILSAGQGNNFPAPGAGEYALITLYELDVSGNEISFEIAQLTSRTADTLTVVRNFEPITGAPYAYPTVNNGSTTIYVALRWTAYAASNILYKDTNLDGLTDPAQARANLGVTIGTNVQAYDAGLASIAGLTTAADRMIYTTALDTYAVATLTSFARTLLDDTDAATMRATLGLVLGTNVQAYDAGLASIAGLTTAADQLIYTTGSDTYTTGTLTAFARSLLDDPDSATMRTTLGLAIGSNVQAYDVDTAKTDVEQTFTAQQTPMNGTLTDGATVDWNGDTNGQVVSLTTAAARTFNAPTNINQNALYVLVLTTGGFTPIWNSAYKWPDGTAPTGLTGVCIFTFIGGAGNTLLSNGIQQDVR